jgi:hypothetical protein
MSHYFAKQIFLQELEKGAKSYRAIRSNIKTKYRDVDVKNIRDELEKEKLIEYSHSEMRKFGSETKEVKFYKLTGMIDFANEPKVNMMSSLVETMRYFRN